MVTEVVAIAFNQDNVLTSSTEYTEQIRSKGRRGMQRYEGRWRKTWMKGRLRLTHFDRSEACAGEESAIEAVSLYQFFWLVVSHVPGDIEGSSNCIICADALN
jgi:hypothetical protein